MNGSENVKEIEGLEKIERLEKTEGEVSINMKEILVQSPTGSGKSFQTAMNCLFRATVQNKPVIIATSSKILVTQYIDLLEYIYKNQEVNGVKLSDCLISIVQHTRDNSLTNAELMEFFTNGKCIIVTVHSYLHELDKFCTPNLFNSLLNVFATVLNIRVDEGNVLFNKLQSSDPIAKNFVREHDSLRIPSNNHYIKGWKSKNNAADVISIRLEHFEKRAVSASGGYKIQANVKERDTTPLALSFNQTLDEGKSKLLIGRASEGDKVIDFSPEVEFTYEDVWSGQNYRIVRVGVPKKIKCEYFLKNYLIKMQNHVSLVLAQMYDREDPRARTRLTKEYAKYYYSSQKDETVLNSIINELKDMFCNKYIENMPLPKEDKELLKKELVNMFEYYENFLLFKESPFAIYSYETANEALLNKFLTASEWLLLYYFPRCLICEIEFDIVSLKNKKFLITASEFKDNPVYSPTDFFNYCKNKDRYANLSKKILIQYNKNNKLGKKNNTDDMSDSEDVTSNLETIGVNLNNNIIINSDKLGEKDRDSILRERKYGENEILNEGKSKFTLLLKKSEDKEFFPYGIESVCKNAIDLQNLTKGDLYYLSAKFTAHNLLIHTKHNRDYCEFLNIKLIDQIKLLCTDNQRKINKLFILQSTNELFQQGVSKQFFEKFWTNFIYRFYILFSQKRGKRVRNTGIFALPSQKKLELFFNYFNFKQYVSMVRDSLSVQRLNFV